MNDWLKYAVFPGKKTANTIKYDLTKRTVTIKVKDDDELRRAMDYVKRNPLPWNEQQQTTMDDYGVDDMVQMDRREPPFPGEQ